MKKNLFIGTSKFFTYALIVILIISTFSIFNSPAFAQSEFLDVVSVDSPNAVGLGEKFSVDVTVAYSFKASEVTIFVAVWDVNTNDLASGTTESGSWVLLDVSKSGTKTVTINVEALDQEKTWHLAAVAQYYTAGGDFTMSEGWLKEFDVEIKQTKYMLTLSVNPSEAKNYITLFGAGEYESGERVEVTAAEKAPGAEGTQYIFEKLLINGKEETTIPTIITVDQDYHIVFKYETQHYLTIKSDHGTTSGEGWYDEGDKAFASLDTNKMSAGIPYVWKFKGWSGDASGTGLTSSPITMDQPKTAAAIWEQEFGCIIATATYGSELSPEVTFLRSFRDDLILTTYAGNQFMQVFNGFYYSFSPTVARIVYEHTDIGTAMKFILYPLLGTLHLSAMTYSALSFSPELAVVLAGLVASSLIGFVYFSPIVLGLTITLRKFKKIEPKMKHLIPIATAAVISIVLISIGEITKIPILGQVATAVYVLSIICCISILATIKILVRLL